MSSNVSKDLIDLIDSRIASKKTQRVAVVSSVSEDKKTAVVRFPETKTSFEFYNKSNEVLKPGESVYVSSNDGDLMNGYISDRFGASAWLVVGDDLEVGKDAIGEDNIINGSVTNGKIADFSVTNAKIGYAEITTAKIRDAAITNAKIENAAITNAKIQNAEITGAKIAVATIGTANIKTAAITTALIADAAIETSQVADGSITDAKIVGLTANKIMAGTIDAGKISVVNLDAANITVGKINGVQIEDGAIGIAQLDILVNDKIATAQETADGKNTIFYHGEPPTADNLRTGDTWFDIDDGYKIYTYDGNTFIPTAFGTSAIDDSAITGTKLANGSITGVKLVDGTVTAREIATGAITANELAAHCVTANAIESKSITATHIDSNTITADKLLLGDASSFVTIEFTPYIFQDWSEWSGRCFTNILTDDDGYVYPIDEVAPDFFFSLPYDASVFSDSGEDNEFAFVFSTKNTSPLKKTALLAVYFFNENKAFIEKNVIETLEINGSSGIKQDWNITKTIIKPFGAKYFVFGVGIEDGFTCSFKDIRAKKTVNTTFISDGSITTNKIVAEAITSDKIAARSILANKIAANSITAAEIQTGTITAASGLIGSLDAAKITVGYLRGERIEAGSITANLLSSDVGSSLDITSNKSITLNASVTDALELRLGSAEQKITPSEIVSTVTGSTTYLNNLGQKANASDLNLLGIRVSSAEQKITPSEIVSTVTNSTTYQFDLDSKADYSDVSSLSNRVYQAEQSITPASITSVVRASSEYVNDLGEKANTREIISVINQTAEAITIDASKINFTGYATFTDAANYASAYTSDLASRLSSGTTTINGGCITTGTIDASQVSVVNIDVSNLNFTGALNGYNSNTELGFSVSAGGIISVPDRAPFYFGYDGSTTYIVSYPQSSGGLIIANQVGDISLSPGSSYVSKVSNLRVLNPLNVPTTSESSANKISSIIWKNSTYVEVSTTNGLKGITVWDSDRKWKTNISNSTINALEAIKKIKPRSFDWVNSGEHDDCGFIAQEIEEAIGEKHVLKVTQEDGSTNFQIMEKGFIPLLTKGIQELDSQMIETTAKLQSEIAILKLTCETQQDEINRLKADIEQIKSMMN